MSQDRIARMRYHRLGRTSLEVSEVCLGTMTFGEQNTEAEAHALLDMAFAQGVNFIDAAELYPVPARRETQGSTEKFVGSWLKGKSRDKVILATKVAGPGSLDWIRGGPPAMDRTHIFKAIEDSLKRLGTDYVDLYQLHWPARNSPIFGAWRFDPQAERVSVSIQDQLTALGELVKQGKIRHIGLSNETPWGVMSFLHAAEVHGLPRVVSIQNAYHLANRTFENGLDEVSIRENVGLLAYSPLAFGYLSGKYLKDPKAAGRVNIFEGFNRRYNKPPLQKAVAAYVALAEKHKLPPAQMALAFVASRPFVTSTIIGATNLNQLKENLAAFARKLPDEIINALDELHLSNPNPTP